MNASSGPTEVRAARADAAAKQNVAAEGTPHATVTPLRRRRRLKLTPVSTIPIRPVRWLWAGRLPLGALSLLGGREGTGKSTVAYSLAAAVTRGQLDGRHHGQPRSVLVAATEDSWEHTIVPRLLA